MATPAARFVLPRWLVRFAPRRNVNFGGLFILLLCLNGCFALLTFLLRTRIYDDQMIFIYLFLVALNLTTIVLWFRRVPEKARALAGVDGAVGDRHHESHKKRRDKKHDKKRKKKH